MDSKASVLLFQAPDRLHKTRCPFLSCSVGVRAAKMERIHGALVKMLHLPLGSKWVDEHHLSECSRVGQSLQAASHWLYQLFRAHTQHNMRCCGSGFVHRTCHYVSALLWFSSLFRYDLVQLAPKPKYFSWTCWSPIMCMVMPRITGFTGCLSYFFFTPNSSKVQLLQE